MTHVGLLHDLRMHRAAIARWVLWGSFFSALALVSWNVANEDGGFWGQFATARTPLAILVVCSVNVVMAPFVYVPLTMSWPLALGFAVLPRLVVPSLRAAIVSDVTPHCD